MTSEKKRAANRRNAARSTGPRTAGGRKRASRNALRHGLAAALHNPAPIAGAEAMAEAICGMAASPLERDWACKIAESQLRLRRVRAARIALIERRRAPAPRRPVKEQVEQPVKEPVIDPEFLKTAQIIMSCEDDCSPDILELAKALQAFESGDGLPATRWIRRMGQDLGQDIRRTRRAQAKHLKAEILGAKVQQARAQDEADDKAVAEVEAELKFARTDGYRGMVSDVQRKLDQLQAKIASRRKRRAKAVREQLDAEQEMQPQPGDPEPAEAAPAIEIVESDDAAPTTIEVPELVVPELDLPQQGAPRPRDEIDTLRDALPELIKLDRYEKRFLARREHAIRTLIAVRVTNAWARPNRR
jgi:hypothetical protein